MVQDSIAAESAHQQHRWHDAGLAAAASRGPPVERLHIVAGAQPNSQACGAHRAAKQITVGLMS